jgi:Ser/Thr protein kinase RdoA (MazF antagonist)
MPHQSEKIFGRFVKTMSEFEETNNEMMNLRNIIMQMPDFFIKEPLRKIITHGDPKINNIIFSEDKRAKALIDIDGCCRNNIVVELADAFRSWCGKEEDNPKNNFDLEKFSSSLMGYCESAKGFVLSEEIEFIPQAIKLVTLELASKFLRDYYLDSYFGWDENKYDSKKSHNLARTKSQLALFEDITRKEKEIRNVLEYVLH